MIFESKFSKDEVKNERKLPQVKGINEMLKNHKVIQKCEETLLEWSLGSQGEKRVMVSVHNCADPPSQLGLREHKRVFF